MRADGVMLYHRDEQTGDHILTHDGREWRYATRAAALSAARDLIMVDQSDKHADDEPAA